MDLLPQINRDVPFDDYLNWPAVDYTRLKKLLLSAADYHLDKPPSWNATQKDAIDRGSAVDCLLFEGQAEFVARYMTYDATEIKARNPKHAKWKAVLEKAKEEGKEILKPAIYKQVPHIVQEIENHKLEDPYPLKRWIECGDRQQSVLWQDSETGLWIKNRPDVVTYIHGGPEIVDLKLTGDPRPGFFIRHIYNMRYHWQAAMYWDGLEAHGIPVYAYWIWAVRDTYPYRVEVYRLSETFISLGRHEYKCALEQVAYCMAENSWPTSSHKKQIAEPPKWTYGKEGI